MKSYSDFGEVASEGWPVLAAAGIVTILLAFVFLPLGGFALGLMLWLRHILRVPPRQLPAEADGAVLAPADGVITSIGMPENQIPDNRMDDGMTPMVRITIRTRLTDAQLQRAPLGGRIRDNFLIPGLFLNAAAEVSARRDNERREITLETEAGDAVMMVQIGTRTARQLICRHGPGRKLAAGAPIGMARLAGLTDLFVPATASLAVTAGQSVLAGETILARLPQKGVIRAASIGRQSSHS